MLVGHSSRQQNNTEQCYSLICGGGQTVSLWSQVYSLRDYLVFKARSLKLASQCLNERSYEFRLR